MTACDMADPAVEDAGLQKETLEAQEDAFTEIPWADICSRMKTDARAELFLRLFQERFNVVSSIEAFAHIINFLGDYMVREFDYRQFCISLGDIDEASSDDEATWTAHMAKHLTSDLVAATSSMLRLAMTISKAHELEASDWKDINDACSNAVRTLPACYRLQRALPGALSIARAWRHLPQGPVESVHESENPWLSEENNKAFEETYNFPWARIEAITEADEGVSSVFSGRCKVVEITEVDSISLVSLEAIYIGTAPPSDLPVKATASGDVILCEVESALGSLLMPGCNIEADFYELRNQTCFISDVRVVAPAWARS
jgi:hypothetical protein